jgi:hypothetical protein
MGISKFPNEVCIPTPNEPWRFRRNAQWKKLKNEAFGVMDTAGPMVDEEGNDNKEYSNDLGTRACVALVNNQFNLF